jgi:hypothetical protein
MSNCYTIRIHYRAKGGSVREAHLLECAKEYKCEPDTHLIDRLLADRHKLFAAYYEEEARIAKVKAEAAEAERKHRGG